jgi:glycerol-3-phosphate dehydrogenase subunit C
MDRIHSTPSDGLSYAATEPKYWDKAGVEKELDRAFDICNGCRLCFNLCPSFPALFDALDRTENDVHAMTQAERQNVVDLCYNCKACEVKCPYTTKDGHDFQLDFARLMVRKKTVDAKEKGIGMRERMLGNPDLLGKMGSILPEVANLTCKTGLHRVVMEKLLGIHRDKKLPEFAGETFEKWLQKNPLPAQPKEPSAKVLLFPTCFVNYYNPAPAKAAIKVFQKNNAAVTCTKQNCCGMPALDGGDMAFAQKQARANVDAMLPYIRDGWKVVALNPTCSMTMRHEYLDILEGDDVKEFAKGVVDPGELLWQLKADEKFSRDFKTTPGTISYHVPCHLKAQSVGFRSRDLMRLIPGSKIATVDACTAHDGTWAMKTEFFEESMKWGKKAFDGMTAPEPDVMATDCPLAAVQIEQGTGKRPIHPMEVLARAYDAAGFTNPVPVKAES